MRAGCSAPRPKGGGAGGVPRQAAARLGALTAEGAAGTPGAVAAPPPRARERGAAGTRDPPSSDGGQSGAPSGPFTVFHASRTATVTASGAARSPGRRGVVAVLVGPVEEPHACSGPRSTLSAVGLVGSRAKDGETIGHAAAGSGRSRRRRSSARRVGVPAAAVKAATRASRSSRLCCGAGPSPGVADRAGLLDVADGAGRGAATRAATPSLPRASLPAGQFTVVPARGPFAQASDTRDR